jgi:hypothetical protein
LGGDKVVLDKMHLFHASSCCCACVWGKANSWGSQRRTLLRVLLGEN